MIASEEFVEQINKHYHEYNYCYSQGFGVGYGNSSCGGDNDGNGFSFSSEYSSGNGDGNGYSVGDGNRCGCGSGYGIIVGHIKSFNNITIYNIDSIQTGIVLAKGNVAKGFILRGDLTTEPCYIVKDNNGIYAHGETLKEAQEALRAKQLERMPVEERIQLFKEHFKSDKLYKGQEFYDWHHTLTGSCKMGRDSFCKEHGINLESEYTVKDFIELTENSYGGEIIKKLKDTYKEKNK